MRSRNKTLVQVSSWHTDNNLEAEDLDFVVSGVADGRLQGLEMCQMESNCKAWRELLDCRSSMEEQIFQETALQRGRGELCIIQQSVSYQLLQSAAARLDLYCGSLAVPCTAQGHCMPPCFLIPHPGARHLNPGLCYISSPALFLH